MIDRLCCRDHDYCLTTNVEIHLSLNLAILIVE